MQWNKTITEAYKEYAITDSSKLEVGKTYYCSDGEIFKVLEVIPYHELRENLKPDPSMGMWVRGEKMSSVTGEIIETTFSCKDRNMDGPGYNPWLVFVGGMICREYMDRIAPSLVFDGGLD